MPLAPFGRCASDPVLPHSRQVSLPLTGILRSARAPFLSPLVLWCFVLHSHCLFLEPHLDIDIH